MANKPISLSKFRKARARSEAKTRADANAVKFGRTKAEKARDTENSIRDSRKLEGHLRDRSAPGQHPNDDAFED